MGVHRALAAGKQQASSMCQIIVLVSGVSSKGKKVIHAGKKQALSIQFILIFFRRCGCWGLNPGPQHVNQDSSTEHHACP